MATELCSLRMDLIPEQATFSDGSIYSHKCILQEIETLERVGVEKYLRALPVRYMSDRLLDFVVDHQI